MMLDEYAGARGSGYVAVAPVHTGSHKDLLLNKLKDLTGEMHDNDILIAEFIEESSKYHSLKSHLSADQDINSSETIHEYIETFMQGLAQTLDTLERDTEGLKLASFDVKKRLESKLMHD